MSTTLTLNSFDSRRICRALAFAFAVALSPLAASAQSSRFATSSPAAPVSEAVLSLPDSPGSVSSSSALESTSPKSSSSASPALRFGPATGFEAAYFQNVPPNFSPVAGPHDKYIRPGQQAPRLSVSNKVIMGIKDAVSPLSIVGWLTAAEYAQLVNGSPNYGTNGIAWAQRFGAATARASSEGIFSDSIMASVLREDPRYYKMGKGHNVLKRIVYAGTRPIIGRTDGGHTTLNLAYISGNLAGSALTQAYYPPVNRGFSQVMQTYGGSIGGGALGFLSSEFLDDILQAVHLEKAK